MFTPTFHLHALVSEDYPRCIWILSPINFPPGPGDSRTALWWSKWRQSGPVTWGPDNTDTGPSLVSSISWHTVVIFLEPSFYNTSSFILSAPTGAQGMLMSVRLSVFLCGTKCSRAANLPLSRSESTQKAIKEQLSSHRNVKSEHYNKSNTVGITCIFYDIYIIVNYVDIEISSVSQMHWSSELSFHQIYLVWTEMCNIWLVLHMYTHIYASKEDIIQL